MFSHFVNGFNWSREQLESYQENGFVVVEQVATDEFAQVLKERYSTLSAGNIETGTNPDNFPVKVPERDLSPVTR